MFEGDGLETLDLAESLRLLSTSLVGRIVYTDQTLPVVVPVNFGLDGEAVVIRASTRSNLGPTVAGAILGFQSDDIDPVRHTGWTVSAVGQAELVTDPVETDRLSALVHRPDGSDIDAQLVRVRLKFVRGLRISARTPVEASDRTVEMGSTTRLRTD